MHKVMIDFSVHIKSGMLGGFLLKLNTIGKLRDHHLEFIKKTRTRVPHFVNNIHILNWLQKKFRVKHNLYKNQRYKCKIDRKKAKLVRRSQIKSFRHTLI